MNYQNNSQIQINDQIEAAISARIPVLLTGNPGVGKTYLAVRVCERLFGAYNIVDCGFVSEPTDLFVQPVLNKDGLSYEKTEVALYPERPLILDEINRVQNERALNALFGLLDFRKKIYLPQLKEHIEAPKTIIATANIGSSFVGTVELDEALLSRFVHIRVEKPELHSKYQLIERIANELKSATYRQIEFAEALHEKGLPIEDAIILGFSAIADKETIKQLLEMIK